MEEMTEKLSEKSEQDITILLVNNFEYNIIANEFKYVSKDAIDILKKMLTYDPERRISAEEALRHIWITKKAHEEIDNEATLNALNNLRNFNIDMKLQ